MPRVALTLILAGCGACSSPETHNDAGPDSNVVHSFTEPRCSTSGLVPFRDGMGGSGCDRAGSGLAMAMGMWPDISDLVAPIAYVQSGAPAGGDGSMAQPYPDIASAMTMMPTATAIVLASGTYMLPGTIAMNSMQPLEIRGNGAVNETILVPMQRAPVFTATGAATQLTLSRLAIRMTGAMAMDTQAVGVMATAGAQIFLRDVSIDDAYDGAIAQGATLDCSAVTITGALHRGVSLVSAMDGTRAEGSFADTLVRDGLGQGIVSEGAHLAMVHTAVVRNLRGGLIVRGGDEMMPMSLDTVTVDDNSIVGVSIAGAGAMMTISQLLAAGNQASSDGIGGDGLFIGAGASVTMDLGIMGDASLQGTGSAFVANGRTGVLVSGDAAMPAPMGGNLQMTAALIASNHGGGMFVQSGASVPTITLALVADNDGVGIATTTQGSIGAIQSSQFVGTRNATITTGAGDVMAGDGLAITEAAAGAMVTVSDDEFTGNARFAAIFTSGAIALSGAHGSGNGYPIGVYGANVTMSGANMVGSSMSAPSGAPMTVHGAIIPPP